MKDNYVCRCSHDGKSHRSETYKKIETLKEGQCVPCWVWGFDCLEYRLDNLKYLEQIYEEKQKVK